MGNANRTKKHKPPQVFESSIDSQASSTTSSAPPAAAPATVEQHYVPQQSAMPYTTVQNTTTTTTTTTKASVAPSAAEVGSVQPSSAQLSTIAPTVTAVPEEGTSSNKATFLLPSQALFVMNNVLPQSTPQEQHQVDLC